MDAIFLDARMHFEQSQIVILVGAASLKVKYIGVGVALGRGETRNLPNPTHAYLSHSAFPHFVKHSAVSSTGLGTQTALL